MSPTFALSLGGAIMSLGMLGLAQYLPRQYFGPVSLSILGAFAHMIGQLMLVRLWLIPHAGLAYLVPLFMAAALLFGLINGIVTSHLLAAYPKPAD